MIARQVDLRVVQRSLIAAKLSFSLFQRNLKRPWIDFEEQIVFLHILTFSEINAHDLSGNTRPHGNEIARGDRSKAIEINRKIALARGGRDNGHDSAATRMTGGLIGVGGRRFSPEPEEVNTSSNGRQNNHRDKPAETFWLGLGAFDIRQAEMHVSKRTGVGSV